jgi:outer membrane protein assembly factor BamB
MGLLLAIVSDGGPAQAQDWNQWRGPNRDGITRDFQTPVVWPDSLRQEWRVEVGVGHSSPVVSGESVFLHTRLDDEETVSSFALHSGQLVWRRTYPAPYEMNPNARDHGKGPKSTPVVADGRLFTLGITEILSAFDAASGELLWRQIPDFPTNAPLFGTAASPIVSGDGPGYASPIVIEVEGNPQLITQTEHYCLAVDPATGEELWRLPFTTPHAQNVVTPLSLGGGIVVFSGLEQGTHAMRIVHEDGEWRPKTIWHNRGLSMYMNSPVGGDGLLFGLTNAQRGRLFCLDAETGATLWQGPPGVGDNAVIIDIGANLLVQSTGAKLQVVKKTGSAFDLVCEYVVADSPTWSHPAPVGNRLLVKDISHLTSWIVTADDKGPR